MVGGAEVTVGDGSVEGIAGRLEGEEGAVDCCLVLVY